MVTLHQNLPGNKVTRQLRLVKIGHFVLTAKKTRFQGQNILLNVSEIDQEASTRFYCESWVAVAQLALTWLHMLSQKQAARFNCSGGKTVSNAVEHICHVLVCN